MSFLSRLRRAFPKAAKDEMVPVVFKPTIGFAVPAAGLDRLSKWLAAYFGHAFTMGPVGKDGTLPALAIAPDMDLSLVQEPEGRYLVVYQSAYEDLVVPAYEAYLALLPEVEDSAEGFQTFASTFFEDHRTFMDIWVRSDFAAGQLVFSRAQLQAYPRDCLRLAIWWLAPEHVIDEVRVDRVLASCGLVNPLPPVEEFRHYDAETFDKIRRLVLTREEARQGFFEAVRRDPAERQYLALQVLADTAEVRTVVDNAAKYRRKLAAAKQESKS